MQGRMFVLPAAFAMLGTISVTGVAQVPGVPESGAPIPEARDSRFRAEPAPDWLVWRSFYERIKAQSRDPAGNVQQMLANALGIDRTTIAPFMDLGEAYLHEISRLLADENNEVKSRSMAMGMAALSPAAKAQPRVSINEVLERDGSIARFEARKDSALADHRQRLVGLIGAARIEKLERLLDAEVRNRIRVIKLNRVPPPEALREGTAPVVQQGGY